MKDSLLRAYDIIGEKTPLLTDCGALCGAACCRTDDDDQGGVFLFPGEEELIDDCGLRGYRVGDAQVSEKHAGFVINRGDATCAQVRQLEQDVRNRVYDTFGVRMSPEVRLLGTHWYE